MFLYRLEYRYATPVRLVGLGLIVYSLLGATHQPGGTGRELVITVMLACAVVAWLLWTAWPRGERSGVVALYVLAGAGGVLIGASPDSAASAFVFVAVAAAGVRKPLREALPVLVVGVLATGISFLVYDQGGVGFLAYTLGFAATVFGAANARGSLVRAEQAELLLAESQRSHEEQLRVARLEEQTRIAREIHDVLAHALAGLAIQLEATASLIEQGADREVLLTRVRHAHELAREGLRETRRAVGALRGDTVSLPDRLEALVNEYRAGGEGTAALTIDGDPGRLEGATAEAAFRVAQESLTNVRKHARGADVVVALDAGRLPADGIVLVVTDANDRPQDTIAVTSAQLASTGGGFGLRGMRERAELLGGTLTAGVNGRGWRVELRLPAPVDGPSSAGPTSAGALGPGDPNRGGALSGPVRVLVVDDQALVREGLMTLLAGAPEIEPVAAAADGEEAVALATRHRPDVVLMDLHMPKLDGVEATRRIRASWPDTEIVVLTTHADEASILDALRAGARGYLTKDAGIAEIARAVHAVASHQALLDPVVQSRLLEAAAAGARPTPPPMLPDELTPREAEVLTLIARGLSNGEIATTLVVSEATVKTHVNHVFAKIGARDRAQAVHYAYTHGLAR